MWIVNRVQSLLGDAREWATGRLWIWRVVILTYIIWAGYCHIVDPAAGDLYSGVTLGVHELGHLIMGWAPEIVMVAAGSATQVLVPLLLAIHFIRQRDYFAISVAGSWLSCSLYNLAVYIGDARAQQLPMVSVDSNPVHDWNYLLNAWGVLAMDTQIAQYVAFVAAAVLFASVAWAGWLCSVMVLNPGPRKNRW